jgi:hypothetical protein
LQTIWRHDKIGKTGQKKETEKETEKGNRSK